MPNPRKPGKLTVREELFCQEYLVDLDLKAAAIRAGYKASYAQARAYELLQRPPIAARIKAAMAKREKRTEVTSDRVVKELARIAFSDLRGAVVESDSGRSKFLQLHELPDDLAAAVQSIEIDEHGVKYRLWDKNAALTNLGRHLSMFQDNINARLRGKLKVRIVRDRKAGEAE